MSERVVALARRLEDDAYFLASVLAIYARTEGLDDDGLAAMLQCELETLVPLRLCRRPLPESPAFRQDLLRIATRFGIDAGAIANMIRLASALEAIKEDSRDATMLMAARDRNEQGSSDDEKEHRH